ncbi:MAG TPA: putative quinol monooxygenase [Clostridia bacterium]|nr:putative quinol monooxygenase [Clostridia bacterium]
MLVLVVNWMANPGKEEEVVRVFGKLAAASRQEPGCRMYVVHQHRDDARHFLVYEQYDNDAALQSHRDSKHFQQYAVTELPTLGTRINGEVFQTLP